MNPKIYLPVITVILLAVAALLFVMNRPATAPTVSPTPQAALPSLTPVASPSLAANIGLVNGQLMVSLQAAEDSSQSGTATMMEENGKVKVTLDVMPGTITPQPAHIHTGMCPDVGAVKYPLSNVVNGRSVTTINASMSAVLKQLPLGINVHKSAKEISVYTACGNIQS